MQIEIVSFEDSHADAFRTLNEAWISKHFVLEPKDREVIDDPRGKILATGGRVFMARIDNRLVGCVALIAMEDGGYEVAKMTVDEAVRGRGVGRKLMQCCIDEARRLGVPRLYLETNSSLAPARALYLAMGFKELPPAPSAYARCDTWMELRLPPRDGD